MSARTIAARGRAAAESLMLDSCTIRRPGGWERVDGHDVPKFVTVYTGKAKVQANTEVQASAQEVGGALITQTTRRVDIPVSAPEVQPGDLVDITASLDPQLVGKTFRVTSPFGKTYATAQRLEVKEP